MKGLNLVHCVSRLLRGDFSVSRTIKKPVRENQLYLPWAVGGYPQGALLEHEIGVSVTV